MKPRGRRVALGAGILALAVLGLAAWFSRPHVRFWSLFEPLGSNAQGYPEYKHRPTGIVFVSLPGGKSWMGAQKDDPNGPNHDPEAREDKGAVHDAERRIYLDEGPVHEVELGPLLISKYEVSQAEWKRVMGTKPSHFEGDTLPVEQVSWEDCK